MNISHITRGERTLEKVRLDSKDFIWSAADQPVATEERGRKGRRERESSTCLWNLKKTALLKSRDVSRWRRWLDTLRGGRGAFLKRLGKLINQISERFVNALCSYREGNYHYQPPLFVSRIIRLITKRSPLETWFSLFIKTKLLLSPNDTVSVMNPISICAS